PIAPGVLDRAGALGGARERDHRPFHPSPVPDGLPVRETRGWLFAPDGRVLVLLDPGTGAARLPGGTPEPADHDDPRATLVREADAMAAATAARALYLGHLLAPDGPYALVRYAAALTRLGPP
ncbi:NUDIX hydrolase, partial [Streptomyces sp. SID2131]|nr:NUDIX hydrolase [Streptomyces sp. SID2131]